jgi:hypothetical protein
MDKLPFVPAELHLTPAREGADIYLGPATVVRAADKLELSLPDGRLVGARVALAAPYELAAGDVVLAIGRADGHYVIGVLAAAGRTVLRFSGDVEITSETGSVRVSAARGVHLEAPAVEVRAERLRLFASDVLERFGSLVQSVADAIQVRARRSHTVIAESAHTQAGDCTLTTERQVRINGKAIHLG